MSGRPTERELANIYRDLKRWDLAYRRGEPEVDDWTYDSRYRTLQAWEKRWPDLVNPDSPTQIVEHTED